MAQMQEFETFLREERFMRLVLAHEAAQRWELHRSSALFWNRLVQLGAYIDNTGQWRLGDLPAAGSRVPN